MLTYQIILSDYGDNQVILEGSFKYFLKHKIARNNL